MNNIVTAEEVAQACQALRVAGVDPAEATRGQISRIWGVGDRRARTIREWLRRGGIQSVAGVSDSGAPKNTREEDLTQNAWTINLVSDRVKNYEELVEECSVDLTMW